VIVHGDMKPDNVLIDDSGSPRITDFGISVVYEDQTVWNTVASKAGGTLRYMSPELLLGDENRSTKESDVYAYAMTCYHVLTGKPPFYGQAEHTIVITVAIKGARPNKPNVSEGGVDIDSTLWDVMTKCWNEKVDDRPTMHQVCEKFAQILFSDSSDDTLPTDLTSVISTFDKSYQTYHGIPGHFHRCNEFPGFEFVAVKVIPSVQYAHKVLIDDATIKRRFNEWLGLWHKLQHDNIMPLLGVYTSGRFPFPVIEWQEYEPIMVYLQHNPSANRYKLLRGVAQGLTYLHGRFIFDINCAAKITWRE